MKIPKEIEKALNSRVIAAQVLMQADSVVSKFIDDNNIKVEDYDYRTGCEMYINPQASADRVRKAIMDKEG